MDDFSVMLLNIAARLDDKELKDLKFICRDKISKKKMEQIKSGTDLFTSLLELNEISNDNLVHLIKLLKLIKREDLVKDVVSYQTGSVNPTIESEIPERNELDQAFDILCDNIGSNWKMFMRRLGISDVILDRAMADYPCSMYEQQMQSLREWRKKKGDSANVSELVNALNRCNMKLIADILTEELNLV
ncbi:FAS-associated death domain protein [Pelodytes ibericus]